MKSIQEWSRYICIQTSVITQQECLLHLIHRTQIVIREIRTSNRELPLIQGMRVLTIEANILQWSIINLKLETTKVMEAVLSKKLISKILGPVIQMVSAEWITRSPLILKLHSKTSSRIYLFPAIDNELQLYIKKSSLSLRLTSLLL